VGAPGTGKSTLARALAVTSGATVVESDAVRKELFQKPRYSADEHDAVFQEVGARIVRGLQRGELIIADATNLRESFRQQLTAPARALGARVLILVTWAAPGVVRGRLKRRAEAQEPDERSDADWFVYLRLRKTMEPITEPHILVNTTVSTRPVLQRICEILSTD
jgi:predicted kinase